VVDKAETARTIAANNIVDAGAMVSRLAGRGGPERGSAWRLADQLLLGAAMCLIRGLAWRGCSTRAELAHQGEIEHTFE